MIPIKKINIDDLEFKDGRYVYTFTADEDMESIDLESSCFGDTTINYLQVEKNPDMTYFVPPEVYEGNISGIFKDLKELNIEMTDTENSDLWGRIKINAQGMIEEWHNDVTSVELAKTADGIGAQLTDLDKKLSNEITLTSQGIGVDLKDLRRELNTQINVSASGLRADLRDTKTGLESQITATSNHLTSRINDANNNYSSLTQTVNGINYKVGNLERKTDSQFSILKNQIASTVTASDVRSIIQQSHDSIRLAVEDRLDGNKIKSAINLTTGGVKIKGDLIHLSGRSQIDNGVIRDAHIGDLSATKITAGTLNAANVRIINLDVNNLVGNKSQFMQSLWQAVTKQVRIDGTGVFVNRYDGTRSTRLDDLGLQIYNKYGNLAGYFRSNELVGSGTPSLSINAEPGNDIRLGIREGDYYMSALTITSNDKRVIIHDDLQLETGNIRIRGSGKVLRINSGRVGGVTGIFITNESHNGAGLFLGDGGTMSIRNLNGTYSRLN